jgi:hypothetical protein
VATSARREWGLRSPSPVSARPKADITSVAAKRSVPDPIGESGQLQRLSGTYRTAHHWPRYVFSTGGSVTAHVRLLPAIGVALLSASCATAGGNEHAPSPATSALAPLFLREDEAPLRPGMLPTPYIGRETGGVLSVDESGCVYQTGPAGEHLIIWPPDAVFEPQDRTFQTKSSGVLRFGDRLWLRANPGGPLERSRIGNVYVPEICRRMNTLFVAPDGARKM